MTSLLDLRTPNDHALKVMLCFLAHNDGKARFAQTGRRARVLHALMLSPGFTNWARLLSDKHRRWVAGLTIAPMIRAGFESGAAVSLGTVGKTNDAIKRLVACNQQGIPTWRLPPFFSDAVVFLALGLLTDSRIEEILKAKLNAKRWGMVFTNGGGVNTILIDPLFTFAELGKEIITSRYEMMVAANKGHGTQLLMCASNELKADRGVVEQAVKKHGMALQWASAELKSDRGIAVDAITQDAMALQHVSDELKADRGVVEQAVKKSVYALQWASIELQGDKILVEGVVKRDGRMLRHASDQLKGDRSLVEEAMKTRNGAALQYASNGLKGDRNFILEAVEKYGGALQWASTELKADHWVVLQAVKKYGGALQWASAELKSDRGVVIVAVKQDGQALRYASAQVKADRSAVMAAVTNDGEALRFASATLKADREVVAEVAKNGLYAVRHAPVPLQQIFGYYPDDGMCSCGEHHGYDDY